jgi:hypothetical protein
MATTRPPAEKPSPTWNITVAEGAADEAALNDLASAWATLLVERVLRRAKSTTPTTSVPSHPRNGHAS